MRWQSVALLLVHLCSFARPLLNCLFLLFFLSVHFNLSTMMMAQHFYFAFLKINQSHYPIQRRTCLCRGWHSLCRWLTKATSELKCKHITTSQVNRQIFCHFFTWDDIFRISSRHALSINCMNIMIWWTLLLFLLLFLVSHLPIIIFIKLD